MTKKIIKNNLYLLFLTSIFFAFYSYVANAAFYEESGSDYSSSHGSNYEDNFFASSAIDPITNTTKASKIQASSKMNNQIISNTSSNDKTRTLHNTIIIRTKEQNTTQNRASSNVLPVNDNNRNTINYTDTRKPNRKTGGFLSYWTDEWWKEEIHDRGEPYIFVGLGFNSGKHIGENNAANEEWSSEDYANGEYQQYNESSTSVGRKEIGFSLGLGVKIHDASKTFFVAPEITYNYFGSFAADTAWYGGYDVLAGTSANDTNATVTGPSYTRNRTRLKDIFGVGLRLGVNLWRITPYFRAMVGLSRVSANTTINTEPADGIGSFSEGQISESGEYDKKDRLQFAWALGGGVELHLMRHFYIYAEYMHYITQFAMRTELNKSNTNNGMKNSLGIGIISVGLGYWF